MAGVIDGFSPKGVETEKLVEGRKNIASPDNRLQTVMVAHQSRRACASDGRKGLTKACMRDGRSLLP